MPRASTPPIVRLLSNVIITSGNCWEWQGARRGRMGYSTIMGSDRRLKYGHVVSYESFHGQRPDGMVVRHTCDNPICVQPDHLIIGTSAQNHRDMMDRGRGGHIRGEGQHLAKLTEDAVRDIRASNDTSEILAARYGVSKFTIWDVVHGRTWVHVV